MIKWWALKDPKGKILEGTIAPTKLTCWEHGFWAVSHKQGEAWNTKYWKRWEPSIRGAQKLGYKFVRVKIAETR